VDCLNLGMVKHLEVKEPLITWKARWKERGERAGNILHQISSLKPYFKGALVSIRLLSFLAGICTTAFATSSERRRLLINSRIVIAFLKLFGFGRQSNFH
jgi:hypothetical protein